MQMVMNDENTVEQLFARWQPQARKGWLETFILLLLSRNRSYGYEIATSLREALDADLPEGTLYPLLRRMQRDGLVDTEWDTEGSNNPRKYYTLSDRGRALAAKMHAEWLRWTQTMHALEKDQ